LTIKINGFVSSGEKKEEDKKDIGKKLLRNSWEVCSFQVRQLEFTRRRAGESPKRMPLGHKNDLKIG